MKGFVMSGLKAFSCVVVLCGAMVNAAIASPRIEARGQLGRDIGEGVGAGMGGAIGAYSGAEIGDRVEDFIRGVDREPQAPREPTYDRHFVYDR
ncbi:pantothenate kinase [Helicobacter pylori]|uniref:pantothenate kinase n=1 Tax=Helicobacter pylori TaxID=210 RepID=UPI0030BD1D57